MADYFSNLMQDPMFNMGLSLMSQWKTPYGQQPSLANALQMYQGMQQQNQASAMNTMKMEEMKRQQEAQRKAQEAYAKLPGLRQQFTTPAVAGAIEKGQIGPGIDLGSQQAQMLGGQMLDAQNPLADMVAMNQSANYPVQGTAQELPLQGRPEQFDVQGYQNALQDIAMQVNPQGTLSSLLEQQQRDAQRTQAQQQWQQQIASLEQSGSLPKAAVDLMKATGPEMFGKIGPGVLPKMFGTDKQSPTAIQEYEFAKQQGFGGNYLDFVKAKKERPQTIIVGQKPQYDIALQEAIAEAKARGTKRGAAIGEQQGNIPLKEDALSAVKSAKSILDKGIYTGAYADIQKSIAKYTPGMDTEKAANTEDFISAIGNTIVPRLKEFGGNDSNEELKYLQRIQGGDIKFEKKALQSILDRTEKFIERGIYRAQKGADPNTPVSGEPSIPSKKSAPKIGESRGGYYFKGGDPANPKNWVKQ